MKESWKSAFAHRNFRLAFIFGIIGLAGIAILAPIMVHRAQLLKGPVLNDPLLRLFDPVNASWFTFFFINGGVIAGLMILIEYPYHLVKSFHCYWIITVLRMISINVFPLDPPSKLIVLTDPFLAHVVYNGNVITKDLFFSGHVSTMFIIFLCLPPGTIKKIFFVNTLVIAALILLQHVHYTIDVIAAFPISWIVYRLISLFPFQQKTVDN